MATTEEYAQQNKYAHSLFVADYDVTHTVSWNGLNDEGLIFGKNYASGGVDYTLRAPSVGSNYTGSGNSERGVPQSNEWDTMLNKDSGYIQNWNEMYSWGRDTVSDDASHRAVRGYHSARYWNRSDATYSHPGVGFRPVLEVLNPDTLGSDGLKVVTLDLNGGKLGGSSGDIQIIVKKGSTFTAPMSGGLTRPDGDTGSYFMWLGSNGKLYAPGDNVPADVIKLTAQFAPPEQFNLVPGGRYYFDLSAMNIPGTVNSNLPDKTLHYVPFTYVGTVDAYSMENETDTAKQPYEHSLFIADYNVKCSLQRETLAEMNLIYGQTYTASNVNYTLRAPSVGDHHRNEGEGSGLAPIDNEWDTIYQKSADYIKNWYKMRSFGQDIGTGVNVEGMYLSRGGDFAAKATFWARPTLPERDIGFRPVLELPTDLAADSLKVVELFTKGRMPGETYNRINIIVKKGESFKAPSAEGLPLSDGISADTPMWWEDENLNFYKPGDTVPADVSSLIAFYGGFGLFLDRGDGAVEVTPDNYTDIFGDGTASFVLPKGKSFSSLRAYYNLPPKDILEIYSIGRLEKYGCVFPNLKLKNADLTSVRLSEEYIGHENPLFVTLDGKNTVGSLNGIIESHNTLCVIGDGSLTLNGALTLGRYTQFGGGSVTMTDGLTAYYLTVDSGSLTVTGDPQAITLANQPLGNLEIGDGVRLFTGSSAQDAAEAVIPQLSAEMQELYQRYLAGDNTLTYEEIAALNNALIERVNAISQQLSGKTYVRITGAWDVTYQPGTNGSGNAVTDIKFYNDALTLRGALFTRTGYTQIGWATVDGGEKVYGLDAVYTQNEALTLYPVWNANQYTITFDTDGGTDVASITQAYGTPIIAPANPTKPGCTFTGWNPELPAAMPAENLTVTAQWSPDIYAITYNLDGGTASGNPDFYTVESSTITLNPPTRTGYTFIGWSGTDLSGSDNLTVTIPTGSIGNRSYTAHWSLNTYSITYDLDGGTAFGNPDSYTVESAAITLTSRQRPDMSSPAGAAQTWWAKII